MSTLVFRPKLTDALRGYNRSRLSADIAAGLTVSVVALPLALAFAIASGLSPQTGLVTAIVGGFLISALGGSRVQIGGPAGAFIVLVAGIVQTHGVSGLMLATLMSGLWLLVMGILRMGVLIRFIPVAVITGFTNGIAVLIAFSQCKHFFGLSTVNLPTDAVGLVEALVLHIPDIQPHALGLNLACLSCLVFWQFGRPYFLPASLDRYASALPGPLLVLLLASLGVWWAQWPVDTIGSRFGSLPPDWLSFHPMSVQLLDAQKLLIPSLTLALLGAIESLLCARVADSLVQDRHDPNQELMAQGIANAVMPWVGGMPATGTIARTMTNIHNGASSPVAGMVHAIGLWLLVWLGAPLVMWVPLGALSAILLFVAWNMGDWKAFSQLKQFRWPYRWTLLAVFALTVLVDLTVAIEVGLAAACLTFIYRISSLTHRTLLFDNGDTQHWAITGALFFGAVDVLNALTHRLPKKTLLLDFKGVIYMDSSGADAIKNVYQDCQTHGVRLALRGLNQQPKDLLNRIGLLDALQTPETILEDNTLRRHGVGDWVE